MPLRGARSFIFGLSALLPLDGSGALAQATVELPQITVRVFNNNEKVYDLYAQFFNSDNSQIVGTEGSVSATDLAQPFGTTLYNCPTILGIPLFDTNYVDYVVTFPLQGNTGSSLSGTIYGAKMTLDFGGGPSLTTTSAIIAASYNGGGNPLLTVNYDQGTNVQPPQPGLSTTTTPASTEQGSTVITPPTTTTVATGSNLDE